ncbi:MAG: aminotransferase class I/II-fold pyridoxal phosphate-dependent enzyme [Vicingaceae bacterium]
MNQSKCKYNVPLREVLVAVNEKPAGTAFIVDEKDKLCGIFTDGDLRRLLLKGRNLEDKLLKEDLGAFVYAEEGESIEALIKKTNKIIKIIPIVNREGHLIDYFRNEHKTHFTPIAEPKLKNKEFEYLMDAFASTWISSRGKYIDQFEENFAQYIGVNHGVATSNGTVAIHLALKALNIGEGDEVIIPDITFAATANAVLLANATPVIVDVEEEYWTIDPAAIEAAIGPNTKAIMPVHVYGQACDMGAIMKLAQKHNLRVIEDSAEAHGAEFEGQKVGSFGDISTFSFFANKIITTGEGGMCLTNSAELDERMRVLRDHGMNKQKRYWHDEVGFNYRMTNLQAAIGCAQLEEIDNIIKRNNEIEQSYIEKLDDLKLFDWQTTTENRKKVVWLVAALSHKKEAISKVLQANNIDVRPFFYPLTDMPVFAPYAHGENKISKKLSERGLNLPTVEQVDFDKVYELLKTIS